MHFPYRPPLESAQPERTADAATTDSLSAVGITLAAIALSVPVLLSALGWLNIVILGWDSFHYLLITCLLCLPLSIVGVILSGVALIRRGSWRATIGIFLAILSIPVCLGAAWLLAMIGLALHPL